jgi:co-chaperonin GroES (HSP10)
MKLKPVRDRIILLVKDPNRTEETASGISLVKSQYTMTGYAFERGEVVDLGPKAVDAFDSAKIKLGDIVHYHRHLTGFIQDDSVPEGMKKLVVGPEDIVAIEKE